MKKLFLSIFIILSSLFTTFSQNKRIVDSLETALKKHDSNKYTLKITSPSLYDTTAVEILNNLSMEYSTAKSEQALGYANRAISLSEEISDKKVLANSYNNIGIIYFKKRNYQEALKNYLVALKIREEIGDKKGIANSYKNIGVLYYNQSNYPEALKNHLSSLKTREEIHDKNGIAESYISLGNTYFYLGNYKESLKKYQASLKISEEMLDKKGIAASYNAIGVVYQAQANFPEALKNHLASLKIKEEIGDKEGFAYSYANIGRIYLTQGNYPEALKNIQEALKIFEEIGDKKNIAKSYGIIASIYTDQGNYQEAIKTHLASLKVREEIGDKKGIGSSYNDIAIVYQNQGNYQEALKNNLASLTISEEIGDKNGIALSYSNIGIINTKIKNYQEAVKYFQKGIPIFKELRSLHNIMTIYQFMALIDSAQGNHLLALEHYKLYVIYRDSIFNNENTKKQTQQEMKYDFDKKEALTEARFKYSQDSISMENKKRELNLQKEFELRKLTYEYEKKQAQAKSEKERQQLMYEEEIKRKQINFEFEQKQIAAKVEFEKQAAANKAKQEIKDTIALEELQRQKLLRNGFIVGFCLTILLASSIFFSLQQNKKKNIIISSQKKIVEDKNKEITDSITYALRIQTAILPPQKIVRQYLDNSFILYKPKDIVAGDFYWMETIDNLVLFAACDCTGHGVPGAMVSVVCHNALNRAVREFGLTQPATILDKTTEIVLENFSKSEEEIQDGMDISICALNTKTKSLEWAGANNPIWIINNGELIETKSDKQCIGHNDNLKPFTNHQFSLDSGSSIYLFTDGFADQFGGERGRKLTKSKFKELLLSIQHLHIRQQATELDEFITHYKKETDQTDDILVIGVRV